jgi:hypothetical protein
MASPNTDDLLGKRPIDQGLLQQNRSQLSDPSSYLVQNLSKLQQLPAKFTLFLALQVSPFGREFCKIFRQSAFWRIRGVFFYSVHGIGNRSFEAIAFF